MAPLAQHWFQPPSNKQSRAHVLLLKCVLIGLHCAVSDAWWVISLNPFGIWFWTEKTQAFDSFCVWFWRWWRVADYGYDSPSNFPPSLLSVFHSLTHMHRHIFTHHSWYLVETGTQDSPIYSMVQDGGVAGPAQLICCGPAGSRAQTWITSRCPLESVLWDWARLSPLHSVLLSILRNKLSH